MNYYPKTLMVEPGGVKSTIDNINKIFKSNQSFSYAEIGIYKADTSMYVLEHFPLSTVDLFDFEDTIDEAKNKFKKYGERVKYFSNSYKFCDSYNYNLLKLIEKDNTKYDYVFIDGAHTFAIDGLAYFLVDILLNKNGYIDFDDYHWTLKNSSLDPSRVKETGLCYTNEQIESKQIKSIVDILVKKNKFYKELVPNKLYQKIT